MRGLVLLAASMAAAPAGAQEELRMGAGITHDTNYESTYGWELDYAHGLSDHAYLSLAWLNEGHQENDHRDDFAVQLWGRIDLSERLSLAFGIGPDLFFDTARDEAHPSYAQYGNDHGLRPIYSAELSWYLDQSWLTYLRANRVDAGSGFSTTMLLLGLGYRFDGRLMSASPSSSASYDAASFENELTLFLGRTTLNSFTAERSTAYAVEYRRSLSPHMDWTLGWLNEGGNTIIRRNGITTQLWLTQPLLDGRLTLGGGLGAYIVANQQDKVAVICNGHVTFVGSDDDRVSGIASWTASYRFDPNWSVRISFDRLVTRYDRDADVILLGGGYSF